MLVHAHAIRIPSFLAFLSKFSMGNVAVQWVNRVSVFGLVNLFKIRRSCPRFQMIFGDAGVTCEISLTMVFLLFVCAA